MVEVTRMARVGNEEVVEGLDCRGGRVGNEEVSRRARLTGDTEWEMKR